MAVWHVLAIAAAIALIAGLDFPSRQAFFPSLIPREQMMSAVALNSMLWQGSRIVLPGLGGVVIAFADTWAVFAAGAVGFMVMARVMASFAPTPAADVPLATGHSGRQFVDGFRFIFSHRMFWVLILLTYATTFFGISYIQLMPAFARLLGAGETGYGLLLSATGVGAIAGNLIVVPLQRSPRLGRVLLAAPMGGAAAILAFTLCVALLPGATIGYVLALGCGMLTAVCMSMYFVASMTQLQLAVPDALRGRVMGIYTICFSLVPLGGLLGGVVAAVTSPPFAAALNAGVLAADRRGDGRHAAFAPSARRRRDGLGGAGRTRGRTRAVVPDCGGTGRRVSEARPCVAAVHRFRRSPPLRESMDFRTRSSRSLVDRTQLPRPESTSGAPRRAYTATDPAQRVSTRRGPTPGG